MNISMQRSAFDNTIARRECVRRKGTGRHSLTFTPEHRNPSAAGPRLVLGNHHSHIVGETGFERIIAIPRVAIARASGGRRGTPSTSTIHAVHSRVHLGRQSSHRGRRHGI